MIYVFDRHSSRVGVQGEGLVATGVLDSQFSEKSIQVGALSKNACLTFVLDYETGFFPFGRRGKLHFSRQTSPSFGRLFNKNASDGGYYSSSSPGPSQP